MKPTLLRFGSFAAILAVALAALWMAFGERSDPQSALTGAALPAVDAESAPRSALELARMERAAAASRTEAEALLAGESASGPLDRDLDLHGVVQDRAANPIAGALVAAVVYPWRRATVLNHEGYDEERVLLETRSAPDGRFRLRLARGASALLRVEAAGFARTEIGDCQAGERVVVTLQPGGALEVLVRDEVGNAVPDVRVRFWRHEVDDVGSYDARRGTTDAEGRCVLAALPPGAGTVECEHDVLGGPGWKKVEILAVPVTTLEVVLPAGSTVRGKITDAETKEPIANACIGENWVLNRAVRSRADGGYELRGFTGNNTRELHVVAEGYGRMAKKVPPEGAVDFELARGDRLRGRVLASTRAPVGGARVTAIASSHGRGGQEIDTCSTQSAADGRFEITSLRRDLPHTLVVMADEHARMLFDFDPVPDAPGTIDIGDVVLSSPRSVAGTAMDETGAPLPRARVTLWGHNADRGLWRDANTFAQDSYGAGEERRCDDLGRFRFPELPPGSYRLTLQVSGAPEVKRQLELTAEKNLEGVELRLPPGASLAVRVVDELGSPVANAHVGLHGNDQQGASARTDAAGTCMLRSLPDAEFVLQVSPRGEFLPATVQDVRPAGQEIPVVVRRIALLTGRVVDPSGSKIPDLEIEAVPASGEALRSFCDERGDFTVRAASGERYVLRLTGKQQRDMGGGRIARAGSRWRGALEGAIAPAANLMIRAMEIEANGILEVRVEDPDGRPVEGARVMMMAGSTPAMIVTDARGVARFEQLVEEEVRLRANPPALSKEMLAFSEFVTARPGQEPIVLKLRAVEKIAGMVRDPEGRPAEGVHLTLFVDEAQSHDALSDAEGRYTFNAPRGTSYRITAQRREPGDSFLQGASEPFGSGVAPPPIQLRR